MVGGLPGQECDVTDRAYRTLLGMLILVGLYFDNFTFIYFIVALLMLEGISNVFLSQLVCMLRSRLGQKEYVYVDMGQSSNAKFNMESERLWRLLVGVFLFLGVYLFESLWFLPWFMGFAIFGAGVSGLCPMLLAIRWLGFK